MRILYVQPSQGIGGAKISLAALLHARSPEQSNQVALAAPEIPEYSRMISGDVEKLHHLYLPTWLKYPPMPLKVRLAVTASRIAHGSYWLPTLRLASIILREQVDLVHTNVGICPVGALAAFLTHRPHIWHAREPLGRDSSDFQLALGDHTTARLMLRLSDEIICNSHYTAKFFKAHGVPVRVICNGIRVEEFENSHERGQALRRLLGIPPTSLVIGMVGGLRAQWKEHALFLRTAAILRDRHPNCQFVVFGGDSNLDVNSYTRSLKDTAQRLNLVNNLTWAGFIEDITAIMHSLDVMVHPPSQEGSGRVIMEAMAAGKPVVGVRSGGVEELIQHGESGYLVPPKDEMALAEAASALLDDQDLRSRMGAVGLAYARRHFSLTRSMSEIQEIYRNLVHRN